MSSSNYRAHVLVVCSLAGCIAVTAAHAQQSNAALATVDTGFGSPIDGEVLGDIRGGDDSVSVDVGNLGNVDGNTAIDVVSGDNRIDGGAFANAAGISTVIQNSGSNVLIQNGTAVNVQFGASPQ